MSAGAFAPQIRNANLQPPAEHALPVQPAMASSAAAGIGESRSMTVKPFKISKEATAEQRSAERQADPSASTSQRKWCSYNPFKSIWRPPQPAQPLRAAKRKGREEAEANTNEDAGLPKHLELDKWIRHVLASRRRQEERTATGKSEKNGINENEGDAQVKIERHGGQGTKTLQERLLHAQIACGEGSNRPGRGDLGDGGTELRSISGWGGVDGVRCRLHSVDRLQGLQPCLFINLFPGGYSIEGEHSGRVYDTSSKEFLAGLDSGKIPAKKLVELSGHANFMYHDGCMVVEVRDYRMPRNCDQKPAVWNMVLEPESGTIAQDLSSVAESHQNLNSDDLLLLEKRMLLVSHPAVCLNPHPHVAVVASSLHRSANRMNVWHQRPTRSAISQFRRTFDTGAMRRLHAAVHVSNTTGLECEAPILPALSRSVADPLGGSGESTSNFSRAMSKGMWKGNKLLEGWDVDGDGKDGAVQMATALKMLKASAGKEDKEVLQGPKSSHGNIGAKKDGRNTADRAAAEGGSGGSSERVLPRNYFLPRQYLRDGMPPERQMRFRKDNQIVTIAIESKGASTYQLRSWLHEYGSDGKPLENAVVHMPPQMIGNSSQARLFGGQLFGVYHRDGWQCTGDSHQPPTRKAGAPGGSGGAAQGGSSSSAAARPGMQPSQAGAHGRGAVAPNAAAASRGVPGAGRGVVPGGAYAGNGPTPRPQQQAPKPKAQQQMATHQPVGSAHMMAGRGAPPMQGMPPGAAPGQPRPAMPHPGGMPGQQMHMHQAYRPPVGMHQAPQQQHHHPHQVASHAAHAAHHQPQAVSQYHAAAGRGYMPPHHPPVAGRGVAPGQPGVRPPVQGVAPPPLAAPHEGGAGAYKPHPGAAPPVHHPMAPHAPQQQQGQATAQGVAAGMPLGAVPMLPMQHSGIAGTAPLVHRTVQAPAPTVPAAPAAPAAPSGAMQQHTNHQPPPNPT